TTPRRHPCEWPPRILLTAPVAAALVPLTAAPAAAAAPGGRAGRDREPVHVAVGLGRRRVHDRARARRIRRRAAVPAAGLGQAVRRPPVVGDRPARRLGAHRPHGRPGRVRAPCRTAEPPLQSTTISGSAPRPTSTVTRAPRRRRRPRPRRRLHRRRPERAGLRAGGLAGLDTAAPTCAIASPPTPTT